MPQEITARRRRSAGVLVVTLAGLVGAALWLWHIRPPGSTPGNLPPLEGLKVFGTVPGFSLTQRDGRGITLADLRGKVWIANFIYTHCTDTCPLQSARMARLQEELKTERDVRFVSFTVDPEQDTPEVLSEYATRFGADRDRWLFLTGEKQAIYALALQGFRLSVADPEDMDRRPRGQPAPSDRPKARQEKPSRQPGGRAGGPTPLLRATGLSLFGPAPALAHPGHPGKPFLHSSRFVLVDRQSRIRGYYQSNDEEALGRLRRDIRALLREGK